jgi:hypothetical protein
MIINSKQHEILDDLCKSVLETNSKIAFVAVINEKGRIENKQTRKNIIEKLPSIKKEMFLMENALRQRMGAEYDDDLGQVRFTYVERKKRGLLSFPINDLLLLVSFRPSLDISLLAKRIIYLINKYKKNVMRL